MLVDIKTTTCTITGPMEMRGRVVLENGMSLTEEGKLVIYGEV